ncbi:DUF2867 domain-containing protein [Sphaerisporangium perillae]|uniref:DUF2867 domain-containing protein n=1 Tax=Sphaerisporangium perillae TaxID=2935860 RepID=UPI00200F0241|nr:DUF2867 domain-containing protein [Sphaerisporangium perillae]
MSTFDTVPELRALLSGADHVDVKTAESTASLRQFVARAMGRSPAWMKALFLARMVLARMLRLRDPSIPAGAPLRAEEISFTPGGKVAFFTVTAAAEDRFIVLEAADTHLAGYLAVVAGPSVGARTTFEVVTVVKYRRWTGPVYFNVIRPFHHLVVRHMANAGARP